MDKKTQRYLLATGLSTVSLMAGCGDKETKWSSAPGTRGFINLDAVKQAFQKDPDVLKFEKRVNEIFEGDNLIIFVSDSVSGGFLMTAKEDLDKDKKPSNGDEAIFTLQVANGLATLQGMGVNSYYKESWVYQPRGEKKDDQYYRTHHHHPYFHYWYFGRSWGGYYTPTTRYDEMSLHRDSYRQTDGYRSQVASNMAFEQQSAQKYGSGFRKGIERNSPLRQSYIDRTIRGGNLAGKASNPAVSVRSNASTSSPFSSRSSAVRSSSGGSSRSSFGSSGFRGSSGFGI